MVSNDLATESRRTSRWAVLLLVAVVLALASAGALWYARRVYAPCDDTYIYLVYAKNLLAGNGLTFNGALVRGFTSVLWMGLVTIGGLLPIGLIRGAEWMSMGWGVVALLITYGAGRRLGLTPLRALVAPVLLAGTFDFAFYMGTGMETMLFCAVTASVVAFVAGREPHEALRSRGLPVLLTLLVLSRPDGIVFCAALLGYLGLVSRRWPSVIRAIGLTAAALFLVELGLRIYYGSWLPNTYFAKSGVRFANVLHGMRYVQMFAVAEWPVLIATVLAGALALKTKSKPGLLLVTLVLAWWLYATIQGGDNLVGFRALLPVVPIMYLLIAVGTRRLHVLVVAAIVIGISAGHVLTYRHGDVIGSSWELPIGEHIARWRRLLPMREEMGLFLRDNFPPGTLIALNAAGIIPFYSEQPTLDMLGLNDAYIARHGDRDYSLPFGHQAGDVRYVLRRKPRVIILGGLGRGGDQVFLSDREMWRQSEFRRFYRVQEGPGRTKIYVRQTDG